MTDWPTSLTVAPIREWPGAMTTSRRGSNFSAPLRQTLAVLAREIDHLADTWQQKKSAELLVAIEPSQFRIDGRPYANARAAHPGVIFSMDTRFGRVSYPCDTFTLWEDNLRGIALALEALRKVDRYGVTKRGEQYRGFLELEATAAPAGFSTAHQAQSFIRRLAGYQEEETWTPRLFREAQRAAHPDLGGDPADFQRVSLAETKLRSEGLL